MQIGNASARDRPELVAKRFNSIRDRLDSYESRVSVLECAPTPASQPTITATAGEALGGHRAVYIGTDNKAYLADNDSALARLTAGLTTGAAAPGANATIQTGGTVTEPSWSWTTSGPVWLGMDGQLTQTVPVSGHLFQVGVPLGPTRLRIEPQFIVKI